MPWFVVQAERKTWTKYLVEAEDAESAIFDCDEWQYLGYVDGDDTDSMIVCKFEGKDKALGDLVSYVDG